MTTPSTKSIAVAIAMTAIVYGAGLLFLKGRVIIPALHWLRSLTPAELETYVGILARASIAAGAVALLAVIVTSRLSRRNPQQGVTVDENEQRLSGLDDTQQQPARPRRSPAGTDPTASTSPPQPRS